MDKIMVRVVYPGGSTVVLQELPWMILQDRHCQMAFGYAKTEEEANKWAEEWDRVHGKCGDHFHKAWVQPTIEVLKEHPRMLARSLTMQQVLDGIEVIPESITLVEVEALPWMIIQDRHGQIVFAYAETKEVANKWAKEWDRVHGKCGDHFHKAWVQPTI